MEIPFTKYQGTGNDFVIIDNRNPVFLKKTDTAVIRQLCDRRFGIGADGLILLQNREGYDFEMIYFNADGRESSMCGNGGRCITAFAAQHGVIKNRASFLAIDGAHDAVIRSDGWVNLKMGDVTKIEASGDSYILDTGSPHYIVFVEDVDDINVYENGQAIRYSARFREEGINVNFVEKTKEGILVATYERGVEDETLSCGTGVTAAAIAYSLEVRDPQLNKVAVKAKGGELEVLFSKSADSHFEEIWLCGPATKVFEGKFSLDA